MKKVVRFRENIQIQAFLTHAFSLGLINEEELRRLSSNVSEYLEEKENDSKLMKDILAELIKNQNKEE